MMGKIGHRIHAITLQEIEYLVIIGLIGFLMVYTYLLYNAAQEDRIRQQMILQRQGNLSQSERIKLDNALQDVTELVPITANLLYRLENQSDEMLDSAFRAERTFGYLVNNFGDEYLIDENRQYAQSNLTQVKLNQILQELNQSSASGNYTRERVDRISRVLNNDVRSVLGSVLSLNNKINELIFTRPESNLSAQARTITNIEQLVLAVDQIRKMLNQSEVTAADITINQTRVPKINSTDINNSSGQIDRNSRK